MKIPDRKSTLKQNDDSLYTDESLRELFSEFDPRNEGMIDCATFKQLLNSMGLFPVNSGYFGLLWEYGLTYKNSK